MSLIKNSSFLKILISITSILIIFDLIYINISVFENNKPQRQKEQIVTTPYPTLDYTNQACPNSCLAQIYQATTSSKAISQIITPTITSTTTPTTILIKTPSPTITSDLASQIKEFFIPFGSGTSSSGDWEDVGGLKTSIDSLNYPSIKSIVFEASISIPTGNQIAYVRLFNETDGHPVWFSDLSLEGGIPQLLISKPITLDSGNKTYKVQMKTSLKYQAVLNQARIHIVIK